MWEHTHVHVCPIQKPGRIHAVLHGVRTLSLVSQCMYDYGMWLQGTDSPAHLELAVPMQPIQSGPAEALDLQSYTAAVAAVWLRSPSAHVRPGHRDEWWAVFLIVG